MNAISLVPPSNEGGNIEEGSLTKRSFFARVAVLGKNEGLGDNSRPGLYVTTVEAACKRVINIDDAEEVFDKYSKAVAAQQGVGWKPQASAKQQVSKLRVGIRLGELTHVNGLELCNKIIAAQKAQRLANEGKNDYSPFDGLVKVSREQIKAPDSILPDDVIAGYLIKGGSDLPEEADRLEKIVKACEALISAKEEKLSSESVDALTEAAGTIMTRIREMGGSTSMRKAADKADKAARAAAGQTVELIAKHRELVAAMTAGMVSAGGGAPAVVMAAE